MLKAADGLNDIDWTAEKWIPPRIQLSTFRVKGKVAELDYIEAGFFLEIPVSRIVSGPAGAAPLRRSV